MLTLARPEGSSFELLGVVFDDEMIVDEASWTLRVLLRTRRYYTDADLIVLYKAHMLSFSSTGRLLFTMLSALSFCD